MQDLGNKHLLIFFAHSLPLEQSSWLLQTIRFLLGRHTPMDKSQPKSEGHGSSWVWQGSAATHLPSMLQYVPVLGGQWLFCLKQCFRGTQNPVSPTQYFPLSHSASFVHSGITHLWKRHISPTLHSECCKHLSMQSWVIFVSQYWLLGQSLSLVQLGGRHSL